MCDHPDMCEYPDDYGMCPSMNRIHRMRSFCFRGFHVGVRVPLSSLCGRQPLYTTYLPSSALSSERGGKTCSDALNSLLYTPPAELLLLLLLLLLLQASLLAMLPAVHMSYLIAGNKDACVAGRRGVSLMRRVADAHLPSFYQ